MPLSRTEHDDACIVLPGVPSYRQHRLLTCREHLLVESLLGARLIFSKFDICSFGQLGSPIGDGLGGTLCMTRNPTDIMAL
mmetsp:Transcript_35150/g.81279  ORF Transcript_35150/g.81279 Transcript_35150/m.81279 type:complete len:81 (-) Transcript_35150:2588-2830(-)